MKRFVDPLKNAPKENYFLEYTPRFELAILHPVLKIANIRFLSTILNVQFPLIRETFVCRVIDISCNI